jgi:uncharacterized membrane protein YesL
LLRALRVFRSSLGALYYELFLLVGVNLAWLGLSLLVVTAPPAAAGVYYLANQLAKGETVSFGLFVQGMRRYFRRSWLLAIIVVVISALLVGNLLFYANFANHWVRLISVFWGYVLIFWLAMLIYLFPLLIEQSDKSLLLILRNAALLVLDNVVFTLTLGVLLLLFLLLNVALAVPLLLIVMSGLAIIQSKALLTVLEKYRERTGAPE